jgi:hypothetical protein
VYIHIYIYIYIYIHTHTHICFRVQHGQYEREMGNMKYAFVCSCCGSLREKAKKLVRVESDDSAAPCPLTTPTT